MKGNEALRAGILDFEPIRSGFSIRPLRTAWSGAGQVVIFVELTTT